ncbi:sugar phosphate isomerase/epimerase family protein [Sinorhizobium sp. 7-81]|uniref:sugar phosphate isomerase/epimerase family protein n=1 Tax=Sinorhizobium sp. 8-89 TaxID=3049089 RepID=UPI0024C2D9B5|nr:sugar phosphate isomerase/epimerase family protein [Sinorhizobium sp. 8-89]MDK1493720.1 sugar phosphate isomerase/epimerase family protein [Sinorhizobium sp. 8-89]
MTTLVRLCAERDIRVVSVWGNEIDRVGEAEALNALREHGITVSGYNRIVPFTPGYLEQARFELERAARFGADHVFLFTGGLAQGDRDLGMARRRVEDEMGHLLEIAKPLGMKLAIEPLHPMLTGDRTVVASVSHANDLCETLGPGIGIVIDVYHVWWDERLESEIHRAGSAGRLLGFHVNDWLLPTKHLLTDRGMMGDGIIDLAAIDRLMREAGFEGPVKVELFSRDWWERDPAEVLDVALSRCEQIFGGTQRAGTDTQS